ncbi:hypothetical protein MTO96_004248 [Rhipicephalus appendiculatus]
MRESDLARKHTAGSVRRPSNNHGPRPPKSNSIVLPPPAPLHLMSAADLEGPCLSRSFVHVVRRRTVLQGWIDCLRQGQKRMGIVDGSIEERRAGPSERKVTHR